MRGKRVTVNDLVSASIPPDSKYTEEEWNQAFQAFFEELKKSMLDPGTTEIKLVNFVTLKEKPITSFKMAVVSARNFHNGTFPEEEMRLFAKKLIKITENASIASKRKIKDYLPRINQWLGEADWWSDIHRAIREHLSSSSNKRRRKAAAGDRLWGNFK